MEFVHVELKRDTWVDPGKKISSPQDAIEEVRRLIENLDREMLIAIFLATDGSVVNASVCSVGSVNQSIVSLAEIFRTGLLTGAASFILIHNHPSGSIVPSKDDLWTTRKCAVAGKLMNFHLLDHIIVGANDEYCSLMDKYESCFEVGQSDFEKLIVADMTRE